MWTTSAPRNNRTWILFLEPQAHITLAFKFLRSWSCVGNPSYMYSTTRIFSFSKRTKLNFDSVRLTQIDINFQQVVLQLRKSLGTTTDPVFLYRRPRSRQIENFPLNSLIHNLSKNIKSRRDFYVMKSAKRTCFLPTTNIIMEIIIFLH